MMTDRNNVTVLQRVFLDQLAIDVSAIGAVQVFKKGIVQNIDDQGVMAAHRRVIDPDIVIRKATNGVTLFGHVVFSQNLIVQTKN
jgi:hypothetical protein